MAAYTFHDFHEAAQDQPSIPPHGLNASRSFATWLFPSTLHSSIDEIVRRYVPMFIKFLIFSLLTLTIMTTVCIQSTVQSFARLLANQDKTFLSPEVSFTFSLTCM